jgi:hypothetical protein
MRLQAVVCLIREAKRRRGEESERFLRLARPDILAAEKGEFEERSSLELPFFR